MTEELTRTEKAAENMQAAAKEILQMGEVMAGLAGMIRSMGDQLRALQQKVAMLEKVTPMQAKDLNQRIRERACGLEMSWGLPAGSAQKMMTAIRRDIRMETGARSARDIARCDYQVVCGLIEDWEDARLMMKLRGEP